MIQDAIKSLLGTVSALTSLVGDNIKPITATVKQGAPICLYQCEAGETPMNLDGASAMTPNIITGQVGNTYSLEKKSVEKQ